MDHHVGTRGRYPYWFTRAIHAVTDAYRYDYPRLSDPLTRPDGDVAADADHTSDRDDNEDPQLRAGGGDAGRTVPGETETERGDADRDVNVRDGNPGA